ncbi:hypothetical protein Pmani_031110 [Petrolisthes manimaculis]|uniref:Uncharacterized protein n=1 Tax=Petrolisthes manimaculis TaxID=1843537 RepID=A0AAE1NUB3_9EUCA|nr:hypothetical protein Pmani_031110 [Petrolisthes manimaculis]
MRTKEGHHHTLTLGHRTPFRYSPLDLALYIYNTGDEESVVMAMLDLVTEGIMTTESAQEFIFDIYENLDHLRNQAAQNKDFPSEFKSLVKKNEMALPLSELYPGGDNPSDLMMGGAGGIGGPEADYESMMERVRGGGSGGIGGGMSQDYASYTQYSLEEVIYQLAKILFKQAMHRGDLGSERALQEVAALLEKEVARGAITPEVEKKVLDVMVNSLVDSLGESEFPSAPGPMIGGNNMRLTNEEASSSYPMGSSSSSTGIGGGSHFNKPSTDLFRLSKSTTKREAPEGEKKTDNKTV